MFDDQLVEELTLKYGHRSSARRPEVWLIAIAPERCDQRAWINQALEMLPEPGRSKLWSRLLDDNHFLQTYNELAVAAIFQGCGLDPRYELEHDGLSPDFTTLTDRGQPTMLIEVGNRLRSRDTAMADLRWRQFRDRVRKIPAPYGLLVRNASPELRAPQDKLAKRIARELHVWLLSVPSPLGQVVEIEGYFFSVAAQLPGTNAELVFPQGGGWVNSDDDVAPIVKEKVKRYASLADELDIPLLVVVGADPRVPIDVEMLQAVMRGQLTTSVRLDPLMSGSPTGRMQMHSSDKPPIWDPALSAVGWLASATNDPGRLSIIPSPQAQRSYGLTPGPGLEIRN